MKQYLYAFQMMPYTKNHQNTGTDHDDGYKIPIGKPKQWP